MVRARGVQVSSAAAPTVLGTAVVRAALLGLLHQSHPGLQKAQSAPAGVRPPPCAGRPGRDPCAPSAAAPAPGGCPPPAAQLFIAPGVTWGGGDRRATRLTAAPAPAA